MSENDKVKPFHAKEVSSGQETADAVKAVLEHAHERDEAAKRKTTPKGQPKWLLPLGLNLSVLAAYLLIAPPEIIVFNGIQPPPPEVRAQQLRNGVFTTALKIHQYRDDNGRLPATLEEAGIAVVGLDMDYTLRGDSNYVLIAIEDDGTAVTYNSLEPLNEWAATNASSLAQIGG